MRWICWISALLTATVLVNPAAGIEPTPDAGVMSAGCGCSQAYCGPACALPFYGWVPGCSQCQPSPCDNAWAGYCHQKARRKAFWYRVGTGGPGCCAMLPGMTLFRPAVQPISMPAGIPVQGAEEAEDTQPALPPIPEPAPENTTRRSRLPWFW